jgi:hypothetical protein
MKQQKNLGDSEKHFEEMFIYSDFESTELVKILLHVVYKRTNGCYSRRFRF